MKRLSLLLAAALMIWATACNNGGNSNSSPTSGTSNAATETSASKSDNSSTSSTKVTMVPGKLNFVNIKEGEQPVMTGLRLAGNIAGSDINNKPYATEGIRCIFELDEWIEFYPQTNAEYGIKVWIIKHKENQDFYLKNKMRDLTPGFVQGGDVRKDPDAEEGSAWGSLYVNADDNEPGYYDFVFTYEDKVFATMLTKFYKHNELAGKSDEELANMIGK
ncbi:MAG: hypothetical protein K6F33_01730 [Bacteroidales bacterium]|nr:hypothetical protein [Bacteroidales bacterium]